MRFPLFYPERLITTARLTHDYRRWLVHELASYYDLDTWSVTRGDPRRREAYIAFKPQRGACAPACALPKPLYGMV